MQYNIYSKIQDQDMETAQVVKIIQKYLRGNMEHYVEFLLLIALYPDVILNS